MEKRSTKDILSANGNIEHKISANAGIRCANDRSMSCCSNRASVPGCRRPRPVSDVNVGNVWPKVPSRDFN